MFNRDSAETGKPSVTRWRRSSRGHREKWTHLLPPFHASRTVRTEIRLLQAGGSAIPSGKHGDFHCEQLQQGIRNLIAAESDCSTTRWASTRISSSSTGRRARGNAKALDCPMIPIEVERGEPPQSSGVSSRTKFFEALPAPCVVWRRERASRA